MIVSLLGLLALLAPRTAPVEPLVERAAALKLHEHAQWRALGHYRDGWFGPYSQADGPAFFLSPTGVDDPQAELAATLRMFFTPDTIARPTAEEPILPPAKRHPQCNFPARYAWLDEQLDFDAAGLTRVECPSYDHWRGRIKAKGATLVFADAYLNNPASMYGHTFLRLDQGSPLLSYAINYSADAWTTNGLLFAVLGIFGGFDGYFSTTPYYVKVQEYTNVESRDLWEYSLRISDRELERLIAHAWELGTTSFDYYFFDENCSYMLLTLLDAMRPNLDLAGDFPMWVLPTDTLRSVISRPDFVAERSWRPAHRSRLIGYRDSLSSQEQDQAEQVAKGVVVGLDAYPPERQARILEAGHLLMRWREGYVLKSSPEWKAKQSKVLRARAALRLRLPKLDIKPRLAPPEEGHSTGRVSVGGGISERGILTRLQLRLALHDLLDDERGYHQGQHLEKLDFRFRWDAPIDLGSMEPTRRRAHLPYLEQLDLVEILSVPAHEKWLFQPAWHARLAVEEAVDLGCAGWRCVLLGGRLGGGLAHGVGPISPIYLLAETNLRAFGPLDDGYLIGLGGLAGVRLGLGPWQVLGEFESFYNVLGAETGWTWTARVGQSVSFSRQFAMRLEGLLGNSERQEASISGLFYF